MSLLLCVWFGLVVLVVWRVGRGFDELGFGVGLLCGVGLFVVTISFFVGWFVAVLVCSGFNLYLFAVVWLSYLVLWWTTTVVL